MTHFLDSFPFDFSRPEARELRDTLAVHLSGKKEVRAVVTAVQPTLLLNLDLEQAPRLLWHELLTLGRNADVLRPLLERASEFAGAALTRELARITGEGLPVAPRRVRPPVRPPVRVARALDHRVLEFGREGAVHDPYALPELGTQRYFLRDAEGRYQPPVAWDWADVAMREELAAVLTGDPRRREVMQLGGRLWRFLEDSGGIGETKALRAPKGTGRAGVKLTIRSAAAELGCLPWELATVGASGEFLGELPNVLMHYEVVDPAPSPPPEPGSSGVLFAWSSAGGQVPAGAHIAAISEALSARAFVPEEDVLPHVGTRALSAGLRSRRPSVLVLLCHGSVEDDAGALCLERNGELDLVGPERIRRLIRPHLATLQCVVLCACGAGDQRAAYPSRLGSLAETISRLGVPAVVASRLPLPVDASSDLVAAFLTCLYEEGGAFGDAFTAARMALLDRADLAWASLQLLCSVSAVEDALRG